MKIETEVNGNFEFHEYANLFPLIEGQDFEDLKKDIAKNGLIEPIWLYQAKILDGRNRYRACLAVKSDLHFRTYSGNDPLSFVVSLNLKRRHLEKGQRAALGVALKKEFAKEAKKRQLRTKENQEKYKTSIKTDASVKEKVPEQTKGQEKQARDKAAEILGVNERYIDAAEKIEQNAPEVFQQLKTGELTMPQAKAKSGLFTPAIQNQILQETKQQLANESEIEKQHQEYLNSDRFKANNAWSDIAFSVGSLLGRIEKHQTMIESFACPDEHLKLFEQFDKVTNFFNQQKGRHYETND